MHPLHKTHIKTQMTIKVMVPLVVVVNQTPTNSRKNLSVANAAFGGGVVPFVTTKKVPS
jgi:hypothetical protein